jgi:hypothetical protein
MVRRQRKEGKSRHINAREIFPRRRRIKDGRKFMEELI